MKILHLYSNWKWTGPAEHALNAVKVLITQGHHVVFLCGKEPSGIEECIYFVAKKRGISPSRFLFLKKHLNPFYDLLDIIKLRGFLSRNHFDLAHFHLNNDHLIGALSIKSLKSNIPIIRTYYNSETSRYCLREKWLFSKMTNEFLA